MPGTHGTADTWNVSPFKGADPAIGFHILRHTYASLYLMSPGADLPGLAKQLGHADTRMTLRHYAHLAESWRAQQAKQAQQHAPRLGLRQTPLGDSTKRPEQVPGSPEDQKIEAENLPPPDARRPPDHPLNRVPSP